MRFQVLFEARKEPDTLAAHGVRLNQRGNVASTLKLTRRDIVRIKVGRNVIYRTVVFGVFDKSSGLYVEPDKVRLQYDCLRDLGVHRAARRGDVVNADIKKVKLFKGLRLLWNDPDFRNRHAVRSAIWLLVLAASLSEGLAIIHAMFLDAWLRKIWLGVMPW